METLISAPANLLVVEVLDAHGRVVQRERLPVSAQRNRFTIGRSPVADVMLDDAHVAALHVAIDVDADGELRVTDLGTLNGLVIDGTRQRGAELLALPGRQLQLGQTPVRLRLGSDALAPELPDQGAVGDFLSPRRSLPLALGSGLVCIFFILYFSWLSAPRDLATPVTLGLLSATLVMAAWTAVWSLLTRVIHGRWRWLPHAAVFLTVMAALYGVDSLLEVLWFSFDLPHGEWREMLMLVLAGMAAMYGHLLLAAPIRRQAALRVAICLPLLIAVPSIWMVERGHSKNVNYIGDNVALFPAALHVRRAASLDDYFSQSLALKVRADELRREMEDSDGEEDEDED